MFDLSREVLSLEGRLLTYAIHLSKDEAEARELVQHTLRNALNGEAHPPPGGDTQLWLFGLMRNAFHSVVRRRNSLRERGSAGRQWRADRAEAFIYAKENGAT
ncbi:MAG: hypothetical protein JO127_01165 [Caulobacteraceae bacterium]|nr:hypothetical protein [Caulobacteraceae bacterium]